MEKFYTHKSTVQELNNSIEQKAKLQDRIDSLSKQLHVVIKSTCYIEPIELEIDRAELKRLLENYHVYKCGRLCATTSSYTLSSISYRNIDEYALYQPTSDYSYYIALLSGLIESKQKLKKQLSKLAGKIRYLYKKLSTSYKNVLFSLIRSIIRKLLKSLDDDTDKVIIKSSNFSFEKKLSFYNILISYYHENRTKERIYRWS